MTVYLAQMTPPRHAVSCDYDHGCLAVFHPPTSREAKYVSTARTSARSCGWSTRDGSGPGGRTAPDLCPEHREPPP